MYLPKERLAELLAARDEIEEGNIRLIPTSQVTLPCYAPDGICTNPQRDCINCPKTFFGNGNTTTTTTINSCTKN